jgi:predicted RNase H-like HicB family nuclease
LADLSCPVLPLHGTPLNSLRQIQPSSGSPLCGSIYCNSKRDEDWWIGWVEEVPGVNAQERPREELLASLRVILAEALEFNRNEARPAAESGFEEEYLSV